jgi:competence protein ComGF
MKWSLTLAIANTIYNLASCILVLVMISDGSLINQDVISSLANLTKNSLSQLTDVWQWSIRVSIAVLILVTLGDSIKGFVKCKK